MLIKIDNCSECPAKKRDIWFSYPDDEVYYCVILNTNFGLVDKGIPEWCPLKKLEVVFDGYLRPP